MGFISSLEGNSLVKCFILFPYLGPEDPGIEVADLMRFVLQSVGTCTFGDFEEVEDTAQIYPSIHDIIYVSIF